MGVVPEEAVEKFREDGFAIIPGFLSSEEIDELKEATKDLVKKYCREMPTVTFSGKSDESDADSSRDTYFAESGDKICGFYEEAALGTDGQIVSPADKQRSLNKIAHALHKFDPVFEKVTFSDKVKEVVHRITAIEIPTVIQSMVIFKHPKIGGQVKPHQDSTYLHTDPTAGCLLGFWIALDDANLENGCLYFIPGSHKSQTLYQRFIRNPDKTSKKLFVLTGGKVVAPQDKLQAVSVKAGDLVLIDGLVVHQSEANLSNQPRMAYTFHVIDGSVSFSPDNWLQPTSTNTFVKF